MEGIEEKTENNENTEDIIDVDPELLEDSNVSDSKNEQTDLEQTENDNGAYEGKSREQLIEMIKNSQGQISKMGNELGTLRKNSIPVRNTKTVKDEMSKIEKEMSNLDDITDDEQYTALSQKHSKLKEEFSTLQMKEYINSQFADKLNKEKAEKFRSSFERDFGGKMEEETFTSIMDTAKQLADGLELSAEDLEAATMKHIGVEKYRKMLSLRGNLQAREDISNASSKTVESISNKNGMGSLSKSMTFSQISSLNGKAQAKIIDRMSYDQAMKYNRFLNNRR